MSFLQKAKEKASEVAHEAADASARAASAVSARAHDPQTQERMKSGLATAGKVAGDASMKAADASAKAATAVVAKAQDPATQAKVKSGLSTAGRGARTMVERIDPGILADVVIKATALQEKANARLQRKGSMYRIGEIQVTASLPPGISFSIERIGDTGHDAAAGRPLLSSIELLAEAAAGEQPTAGADAVPAIVSLDVEEQASIAFEIADAEASMDAAVGALEGATLAVPDAPAEAPGAPAAPDAPTG
ncbi:MAG TPA: hypothetical protein VER83_04720 [Candidatus Nanopelagicales bacterium]|nr:hypothetical protein [Candidatus Nanopelagicales bacterium]